MFCTNCGNELKADQNFCTKCGTPAESSGQMDFAPDGGGTANIEDFDMESISESPSTTSLESLGAFPGSPASAGSGAGSDSGASSSSDTSSSTDSRSGSDGDADGDSDVNSDSNSDDDGLDTTVLAALQEASKDPIAEFNKEPSIKLTAADGREFKTSIFPCVVGKGTIADVQISGNNAISREHIQLTFDDDKFFVADMNSSNYTYINGEKIEPKVKHEVSTGDTLKLADEPFTVEVDV